MCDRRQFVRVGGAKSNILNCDIDCPKVVLSAVLISIYTDKPGPPRFARSTILVISLPNFVKLTLKKFGLAIKITPTKETVAVVSSAESLFLESCMIN